MTTVTKKFSNGFLRSDFWGKCQLYSKNGMMKCENFIHQYIPKKVTAIALRILKPLGITLLMLGSHFFMPTYVTAVGSVVLGSLTIYLVTKKIPISADVLNGMGLFHTISAIMNISMAITKHRPEMYIPLAIIDVICSVSLLSFGYLAHKRFTSLKH